MEVREQINTAGTAGEGAGAALEALKGDAGRHPQFLTNELNIHQIDDDILEDIIGDVNHQEGLGDGNEEAKDINFLTGAV